MSDKRYPTRLHEVLGVAPMEWISVKDRLPEPGEVVLATAGGFVGEAYRDDNGYWRRGYGAEWLAIFGKDMAVTHWCSLPEPPGEEGTE